MSKGHEEFLALRGELFDVRVIYLNHPANTVDTEFLMKIVEHLEMRLTKIEDMVNEFPPEDYEEL